MDPASALGAAAAAFQFAQLTVKATIKGVGLLKSLKETPAKLKELLSVLETSNQHITHLQQSLTDPVSSLVTTLPHDQLSFLHTNVDEAGRLTRELQKELESLFGDQKKGLTGAKKIWRDVISIKRERGLEEKLNKIQWYNKELMRGLQVGLVALSSQILECSNTTQASLDTNTTQLEELNVLMTNLNDKVDDIINTPMAVQARFKGLTVNEIQSTQFSSTTAHLAISVRQEPGAVTKEDLNEMRKDLLMVMTGQKPQLDKHSNAPSSFADRLSNADKMELAAQIGKELLQFPSTLKSSCDFLSAAGIQPAKLPLRNLSPSHRSTSREKSCRCQIAVYNKPEKTLRRGPFSFYYRGEKQHEECCPHKKTQSDDRSWRYQLGMQLAPIVNKTVQVAFSASFGGGGFELQFPMKVFPTVQRSKSPIFKLFDNFPERCAKTIRWHAYEETDVYLDWKVAGKCLGHGGGVNQFVWDVELVRTELRYIHKALLDATTLQLGSVRDRDESGYTVLHEITMLVMMLAPVYNQVITEISALLDLTSTSGIDPQATADVLGPRKYMPVQKFSKNLRDKKVAGVHSLCLPGPLSATAADTARASIVSIAQTLSDTDIPLLNYFLGSGSAEFGSHLIDIPLDVSFPYRLADTRSGAARNNTSDFESYAYVNRILRRVLERNPGLSAYLFDGELAGIVLNRNFHQLQRLLHTLSASEMKIQAFGFHGLSILDLAVGWREGLQYLSLGWRWEVSRTFWLAHLLSDKESLWILSHLFPCMPMNSFVFTSAIQLLSKTGAMDHARILIQAQIRKREELANLGRRHLSAEDQERLGLTSKDAMALDDLAFGVYDSLRIKEEAIPCYRIAPLNPGLPGLSVLAIFSIQLTDIYFSYDPIPPTLLTDVQQLDRTVFLVDVLDELWNNGFRTVNKGMRCSPLEGLMFALTKNLDRLPVIVWLLQHGANPDFFPLHLPGTPCCEANIPHNLLRRLGQASGIVDHPLWAELLSDLVQYAAGVCSAMETDHCVCYCSSGGCLPLHECLLFGRPWNEDCLGHEHEGNMMISWIEACNLTNDEKTRCFEEAVRMELFYRLGLVHTCCQSWRMKMEERNRIREEYEELGSQLNLLMTAYRGSLKAFLQQEEKEFSTEFVCDCMKAKGYGPVTWGSHNLDSHTTRLLAHWRHWWSLMDQILADPSVIPLEHDERIKMGDTRRTRADTMTALALEESGYSGLDYKEVIQRHFAKELRYSTHDVVPSDQHQVDNNGRKGKPMVRAEKPELLDRLMKKLRRMAAGLDEGPALKEGNCVTRRPRKKTCECPVAWFQTQSRCHHSWDYKTQTPRSYAQKDGERPSVRMALSHNTSEPKNPPGYLMVEI